MARSRTVLGWIFLALAAPSAHAQVYKCPDASGRPTYTNVKRDTVGKNCTLVANKVQEMPSQSPSTSGAKAPANVDRNQNRRKILESELQNEQQLLTDAQH